MNVCVTKLIFVTGKRGFLPIWIMVYCTTFRLYHPAIDTVEMKMIFLDRNSYKFQSVKFLLYDIYKYACVHFEWRVGKDKDHEIKKLQAAVILKYLN